MRPTAAARWPWWGAGLLVAACVLAVMPWQRRELEPPATMPAVGNASEVGATAAVGVAPAAPEAAADVAASDGAASQQRTAADVQGSAEQPDTDWLAQRRSSRDFVRLLVRRPEQAATVPLLRSTAFNPRDVWLAPPHRAAVAAAIGAAIAEAERAAAQHETTVATEFAQARDRGHAVDIDLSTFAGRWALSQLGRAPFCREIDGMKLGVRREHVPESIRTRAVVGRLGAGLVAQLADAFANAGALTSEEREALATAAADLADR